MAALSALLMPPAASVRATTAVPYPPEKALADPIANDPVFWWRYANRPADPSEPEPYFYWPSAAISGAPTPFLPEAPKALPDATQAQLIAWAEARSTAALIVLVDGRVALEHYWGDAKPDAIATSRALSRTIPPLLLGFAIAEGRVALDDPIGKFIPEWRSDPRGRITVAQLASNASGLEGNAANPSVEPYGNKFMRLAWSGDVLAAALDHNLVETPGTRFAVVNPNAQLLALVLERAMGKPLNELLSDRVWKPIGAGDATFQLDRPGGHVRAMCCLRAAPRDWARLGQLMLDGGRWRKRQVLPPGWATAMALPSPANASFGMGLWLGSPYVASRPYETGGPGLVRQSAPFLADDVRFLEGGGNRVVFIVPSRRLVIVRLGKQVKDWDQAPLVNIAIAGLDVRKGKRP